VRISLAENGLDLTDQVRSISEVRQTQQTSECGRSREMLDLKLTVNSMVNQLKTLASEVSRVSLEVGMEGILGGQAFVPDDQGMWKVLTDNVNGRELDQSSVLDHGRYEGCCWWGFD
jgi:osomolarity two-component system sensor histidine kinase NIK1